MQAFLIFHLIIHVLTALIILHRLLMDAYPRRRSPETIGEANVTLILTLILAVWTGWLLF